MRLRFLMMSGVIFAFAMPLAAHAAPSSITYTYKHHIITVNVTAHPEWRRTERVWLFNGTEAIPPAHLKSCGDEAITEPGWTTQDRTDWSEDAIRQTLAKDVAAKLDRAAGNVTISKTLSGAITFDGVGLTGRQVDLVGATALTLRALEGDVAMVNIPVTETQPVINVDDEELRDMGIEEVVTIGESVYTGSPVNRRHNIQVGLAKFQGHLIPQGGIFSFVETLGPVDQTTGYRKELVIQGDETLPDYGGGLCQVSSTAYRGPWEYGMPIVQRKNHSYAVSYYSPQGTDATIYPPNVDMKFKNDTPGALLIQTYSDPQDRAYFIYYGTKDERTSEVFGPYITDRVSAPREEKISYTTEIPAGTKRKASERHDGMKATWYRSVQMPGSGSTLERYYSHYQTRPLYWQIGVTPEEMLLRTSGDLSKTPSWLPSNP